jgi:hypothetical protein
MRINAIICTIATVSLLAIYAAGCTVYTVGELLPVSANGILIKKKPKGVPYPSEDSVPLGKNNSVRVSPPHLVEATQLVPFLLVSFEKPTREFTGDISFYCEPKSLHVEVNQMIVRNKDASWEHSLLQNGPIVMCGMNTPRGKGQDYKIWVFALPDSIDRAEFVIEYRLLSEPGAPTGELIFQLELHRSSVPILLG